MQRRLFPLLPARAGEVLAYHVLPARVMTSTAQPGNVKTVHGGNLAASRAGEFVTVEEAMVQQDDLVAANGVVHKVDRVLMPPRR